MAGRATMREVADRAGVAIGTVSAVFAGKTWVSARTRTAVREAAEEIGYTPPARGLARPAVTDLGFVSWVEEAFSPANPYFARVLHGAQQACADHGISLRFEVADPASAPLPLCVERAEVAGVLVLGHAVDDAYLRRVLDRGVPAVLLECEPTGLSVDHVRHDDEKGGHLAAAHLLSLGRVPRMPGVVSADERITPVRARLAGLRRALTEAGVGFDPRYVRPGTLDMAGGLRGMTELLALPVPPSTVLCANDESALGALEALRLRGLRVPDDVAVAGYDDIPHAQVSDPPLTTVATDKELVGAQAVWHLLERLRRPHIASRDTRLAVRLVKRASTLGGV
ncbi:LacI family DNA-binding transcriptional regulator [Streptomyces sp. NPDC049954]|uniref:LacI family DNA-binding transcriptional regulator n=1 Tax=Streptomyces sp. NPDC049954 TaxID=3155779 RepID=UPI00343675E6